MRRTACLWGTIAILLFAGGVAAAQDDAGLTGGLWLPEGASSYTGDVDLLYKAIFWVTTVMFLLVEGLLVVFCIIYRRRPGHRPAYTHGNNTAEITWTVVPGLMLVGLALWQIPTWNAIKKNFPDPSEPDLTQIHVLAQQFKWNIRYPGTKEKYKEEEPEGDAAIQGMISVPFGDKVLIHLRSADVIHSLFIPHMRVKQDAVPGLRNRIWFKPVRFPLVKLKDEQGSPIAPHEEGQKLDGSPRTVLPIEWVYLPGGADADPDREFKEGGKYYEKRIAVNVNNGYTQDQGLYGPVEVQIGDKKVKKKVNILWRGEIHEGEEWDSCDYALAYFDVACAELCGLGHHTMNAYLIVEPRVSHEYRMLDLAIAPDPTAETIFEKMWKD